MYEYLPQDYIDTLENLDEFIIVHPWMRQLVLQKAKGFLRDILENGWDGHVLLDFVTNELLYIMAIGVQMGESKVLEAWAKELGLTEDPIIEKEGDSGKCKVLRLPTREPKE